MAMAAMRGAHVQAVAAVKQYFTTYNASAPPFVCDFRRASASDIDAAMRYAYASLSY